MKSLFIQSFKEIDRRFAFVLLADIAFYFALAITVFISLKIAAIGVNAFAQIPAEMLDITKLSDISQFDTGLDQAVELLGKFKTHITLSIICFIALFIICFTIFKGTAWAIVTKQKMNRKYFFQFFKLMLCLLGGTILLLLLAFWATNPAATGLSTLLIFSIAGYIIPISCAVFKPNKTIKELLKQTWHASIEKFYHFILPTLISGILLLILIWITSTLLLFIQQQAALFLMLIVTIAWQSWMKYYIYLVARGIK